MALDPVDLKKLMSELFDRAEFWWETAQISRAAVVLIGVYLIFSDSYARWFTLLGSVLSIAYASANWRSSRLKGVANGILSHFELSDGLDWNPSSAQISEWLANTPRPIRNKVFDANAFPGTVTGYFASPREPSIRRLLENLEESGWYTKHQANRMRNIISTAGTLAFLTAVIILGVLVESNLSRATLSDVARAVTAVLVFMFSGGYFLLALDYGHYGHRAEQIEERARALLSSETVDRDEAIKTLHDYQISRATSPLLPTRVWKAMEEDLNRIWYRTRRTREQ